MSASYFKKLCFPHPDTGWRDHKGSGYRVACGPAGNIGGAGFLKREPGVHGFEEIPVVASLLGAGPRNQHFTVSCPGFPGPCWIFENHLVILFRRDGLVTRQDSVASPHWRAQEANVVPRVTCGQGWS